jgi:predicted enzyme related to lactoylglutathione lyase
MPTFKALMTAIYPVPNIVTAKEWYAEAFQVQPYFDEPFYVGFNVGGYELGLVPAEDKHEPSTQGVVAYWGVDDTAGTFAQLIAMGAREVSGVQDVGGGILVATVTDPFGNAIGIIHNPHFGKPA